LPKQMRRSPFQVSYEAVNAKLWVHFTKEMYVVGHTCTACTPALAGGARECRCDLFQTLVHTVDQHLATIFRTPGNVVFTRIDYMMIAFVVMLIIRTHVLIIQ